VSLTDDQANQTNEKATPMKPKRFVFQSQMFGFARCDFLLVTASLLGCLVTFGLQKQVFAQDKVEAPN
jgi:hypothetical protein